MRRAMINEVGSLPSMQRAGLWRLALTEGRGGLCGAAIPALLDSGRAGHSRRCPPSQIGVVRTFSGTYIPQQ
jgi:hypothetical protein